MKKTYLIASIVLHLSLFGASYLHFGNFWRSEAIKDSGHAVFDFVVIGPKSKAPVLSDTTGYTSKKKSEAKSTEPATESKIETTHNEENTTVNHAEADKKEPAKKDVDEKIKKEEKIVEKPKPKLAKEKPKSSKNKSNKPKSTKSKPTNKTKSNTGHKSDKALVNLNKKSGGKKSQKESLNSLLDSALADGNNENSGANAEEIGDTLTATQIDAVRQTIRKCWHFPAGLKDVESLIVDIKLEVDRNGYVKKAETVDTARKNSDPGFRIAAENAERAVLDPACNPLPLPKDKYNEWKELELSFNPKDMM